MDFSQLIKQARSFRRFVQSDRIPSRLVRELVDLARQVPSAGNQQPLRYRIVTTPEECGSVFAHLKWAGLLKQWGGPVEGERPSGYVIMLSPAGKNPAIDIGIAAQTMQLAATERGYAACMLGAIDRGGIQKTLGIPAEWEVQLVLALGRPGEQIVLEEVPTGGGTAYWRDEKSVHHVPKRKLEDVLV